DGWMASTTPLRPPWVTAGAGPRPEDFPGGGYHVGEGFPPANDPAAQNPTKLKELPAALYPEAQKCNIYPPPPRLPPPPPPSPRPTGASPSGSIPPSAPA